MGLGTDRQSRDRVPWDGKGQDTCFFILFLIIDYLRLEKQEDYDRCRARRVSRTVKEGYEYLENLERISVYLRFPVVA